ncbi:MAG: PTS sugar transporter subunit IIB [Lachnospiraceae bacterium]|nr:PTS sugar transporter subunit IIB [Lachnospiraceae bacterium]
MIIFSRIDERLLHGEIAMDWVGGLNPTRIVIIDDPTAANPMFTRMFQSMAPRGCTVDVLSVKTAEEKLKTEEYTGSGCRALLVAKVPSVYLALLNAGVQISSINVGNMGTSRTRKRLLQYIWATKEELEDFRAIMDKGVELYGQKVPRMEKTDMHKFV